MIPFPVTFWAKGAGRPRRFADALVLAEESIADADVFAMDWGDVLAVGELSEVVTDADAASTDESLSLIENWQRITEERDTAKAFGDVLAVGEASEVVSDADQAETAESLSLAENWQRSTQSRNTSKAFGDSLTVNEDSEVVSDSDVEVSTEETIVLSDDWQRSTQSRNTAKAFGDSLTVNEDSEIVADANEVSTEESISLVDGWGRSSSARANIARGWGDGLTVSESDDVTDVGPEPPVNPTAFWTGFGVNLEWSMGTAGWRTEIQRKTGPGSYTGVTLTAAGVEDYFDPSGTQSDVYRMRHVHPTSGSTTTDWTNDIIVIL